LRLTLDERGGTAFEVTLAELVEEGLRMLANDAVQQPVLQGAPDIGSRDLGTRGGDVKLHDL